MNCNNGERSKLVYLRRDHCERDLSEVLVQGNQPKLRSEIHEVEVERPTKLTLMEHIIFTHVSDLLSTQDDFAEDGPPTEHQVSQILQTVNKWTVVSLAREIMKMLKYNMIYLSCEIYDTCLYLGTMNRIKDALVAHKHLNSYGLTARLVEYCYHECLNNKSSG